jgi:Transglycosylase SLT domain
MPKMDAAKLIALSKKGAKKHKNLPASMLYAMILQESGGDPTKVGDRGKALGLGQVHPDAAKEMGFEHEEMTDPNKNVEAMSGYNAKMLMRFKDPKRALSAYNAGPGRTRQFPGVAPSAQPYVEDVGAQVAQLTAPGQPFADELNPPPGPWSREVLDQRQVVADAILELIAKEGDDSKEEPPAPPLLAAGEQPFDVNKVLASLGKPRF